MPGSLYEQVMARAGATRPAGSVEPRASASVVLWRRHPEAGLEVFWLLRAATLAFMAGWHAFPGGGLSRRDRALAVHGRPAGAAEAEAADAVTDMGEVEGPLPPPIVPGLVTCALRELFEETGVLVARDAESLVEELPAEQVPAEPVSAHRVPAEALSAAALAGGRRRLLARETTFAELLDDHRLELDASRLTYAGRWITPPLGPRRFDNRFFLLHWPRDEAFQPEVIPGEAESGEWVRPQEAVELWRRGELITAPPILHVLRALAEDGPEAGLPRLQNPAEAQLGPWRRIEFTPGVLLFPLPTPTLPPADRTNTYLLGFGEAVLVDPGSPHEAELERLEEALEQARERLSRRVTAIWLTHHHPDHVGGADRLRRSLGVPVLAHALTARRLAERGLRVDGELADGDEVTLAGEPPLRLRVVHTPGHARGHLCFFDPERRILVAGDMVAGLGTIVIDPPEGDMNDYLDSLRRLRQLEPHVLYPAHGPVIAFGAAKLDEYVRHRLWREERVETAWRKGLRSTADLVAEVYDDVPAVARPLAERQLEAHLHRLRAAGRIEAG